MAENEVELKSLLTKVKEETEKVGLKPNIQKMKTMASGPITSWQIDGETMETKTPGYVALVVPERNKLGIHCKCHSFSRGSS